MKLPTTKCVAAFLSILGLMLAMPSQARAEKSRHVLIIGIDGTMPAAVLAAKTPNIKALAANGTASWDAFAGGVLGTPTRQNTASLPSWNSILIGVWGNEHGAVSHLKVRPHHDKYPCFFKRLKEQKPDAHCSSIVNWPDINERMVPEADFKARGENDTKVAEIAARHFHDDNPDAVFIQFDEVDEAGHGTGFSPTNPKYIAAIEKIDGLVGNLLDALKSRKTYADEDWLIILVTDHGGKNNGHGGDSPEERRAFLIVSGDAARKGEVSPGPGIVDVAPTALKFLGVQIKPEWELDGEPFGLK